MEAPIVPASDAIFGAVIYTNGQLATAPSSDSEWDRLRQHARRMIAASAELMTLAPQNDPGEWRRQTDALAPYVTKVNGGIGAIRDGLRAIDDNVAGVIAAVSRQARV